MAPAPRLLTPSQVQTRTGITIGQNEWAYHEGRAIVVFPNEPSSSGQNKTNGKNVTVSASESISDGSTPSTKSKNTRGHNPLAPERSLGPSQGPEAGAFLNPMQEFNRDVSIAALSTWERDMNSERRLRKLRNWARRNASHLMPIGPDNKGKAKQSEEKKHDKQHLTGGAQPPHFAPYCYTLLEALAATGLRSLRYAKELENIRYVVRLLPHPSAD